MEVLDFEITLGCGVGGVMFLCVPCQF